MDVFYPRDIVLATPGTQPQPCHVGFDGTYVWAVFNNIGGRKLWRIRLSDGVIVGTDGLDTTYAGANASYTLTTATGFLPQDIVYYAGTNEIMVALDQTLWFFNATTFVNTAQVDMGAGNYAESVCTDGTTHYVVTDFNNLGLTLRLRSVNPTTRAVTNIGPITGFGFASTTLVKCLKVNGVIWADDGNRSEYVWQIDPATGAVTAKIVVSAGAASGNALATDGTYLFVGTNQLQFITIRLSDGAYMDANKNVVGTYTSARTQTWSTASITTMACIDGDLLVGVNPLTLNGRYERYRITDLKLSAILVGYGQNPIDCILAGNTLVSCNLLGTGDPNQGHLTFTDAVKGAANLTNVSPGTGPRLSLTFDNPVGISGPGIAGPMDGLGVTGATQILPAQIDLACVIRPDHPDGDADNATLVPPIGEADPIGPPIPTGVGAVTI